MPRWLAILPYSVALIFIRMLFKVLFGPSTKVWSRNSTRSKTFVFGISDLDLTVLAPNRTSRQMLTEALRISKRIFPFLGEAHFYSTEHLSWILPHINTYELKRDPHLLAWRGLSPQENNVERFVFLQRMFFSDAHTLRSQAKYRQQKWIHHLKLTGLKVPSGLITLETVKEILMSLVEQNQSISESLDLWLKKHESGSFDVYRENLGESFKIIAPHLYLWFHDDVTRDETFLNELKPEFKSIIQRQIDWEIWGLYCQRHWMKEDQVIQHLSRLIRVKKVLDPSLNEQQLMGEIEENFRDYFRLSRQSS